MMGFSRGFSSSQFLIGVFIFLAFPIEKVQARVFSMNTRRFGSYFHLEAATSKLGTAVFDKESVATAFDKSYALDTGGEFGFVSATGPLSYRFGIEIIKPAKLVDVAASQSGSQMYLITNDISVIIPKLGLEFSARETPTSRIFIFATLGTASLTFQNSYSSVTISPNASHTVDAKSSATMNSAGAGFEFHMLDTTTFMIEAGYRTLTFSELKYSADVTSFGATSGTSAAHVTGDVVKDTASANRSLDMTGPFAVIGFRFWLL